MTARAACSTAATVIAVAVVVTAAPAGATTVVHGGEAHIDVNANVTNPCTGAVGDVIDAERDSWTTVARSDGSSLLRGHSVANVAFRPYDIAAASYTGEEVFTDVETVSRGADAVLVTHHLRLRGTDGGALTLIEKVRLIAGPDGLPRIDIESSDLACQSR
jgi:hypothetical protein